MKNRCLTVGLVEMRLRQSPAAGVPLVKRQTFKFSATGRNKDVGPSDDCLKVGSIVSNIASE
jgi:hypothetical protein